MRNASRLFRPPSHFAVGRDESFTAALNDTVTNEFSSRWRSLSLTLETITPVYGGGSTAGEVDALVPFRPRSIKNAIRHWWWLLHRRDQKYVDDPRKLHADITRLFGGPSDSAGTPAALVRVCVGGPTPDEIAARLRRYFPWKPPKNGADDTKWRQEIGDRWGYALFPAKGEQKPVATRGSWTTLLTRLQLANTIPRLIRYDHHVDLSAWFKSPPQPVLTSGLGFSVRVDLNPRELSQSDMSGVIDAVRAWITLGGIGARTSRGLGACKLVSWSDTGHDTEPPWSSAQCGSPAEFVTWLGTLFPSATVAIDAAGVTVGEVAWDSAVKRYRDFRQARQTRPISTPARSYWPKVDVLRSLALLNDGHPLHHPAVTPPHSPTKRPLPELFFGAPIEVGPSYQKSTISFEGVERFSSPLLVRPVQCGKHFFAAAIVLPFHDDVTNRPAQVAARTLGYSEWWYASDAEAASMLKSLPPLRRDATREDPRQDLLKAVGVEKDPLNMFLNYFEDKSAGAGQK